MHGKLSADAAVDVDHAAVSPDACSGCKEAKGGTGERVLVTVIVARLKTKSQMK